MSTGYLFRVYGKILKDLDTDNWVYYTTYKDQEDARTAAKFLINDNKCYMTRVDLSLCAFDRMPQPIIETNY